MVGTVFNGCVCRKGEGLRFEAVGAKTAWDFADAFAKTLETTVPRAPVQMGYRTYTATTRACNEFLFKLDE